MWDLVESTTLARLNTQNATARTLINQQFSVL